MVQGQREPELKKIKFPNDVRSFVWDIISEMHYIQSELCAKVQTDGGSIACDELKSISKGLVSVIFEEMNVVIKD